jgi:hypothetical protein
LSGAFYFFEASLDLDGLPGGPGMKNDIPINIEGEACEPQRNRSRNREAEFKGTGHPCKVDIVESLDQLSEAEVEMLWVEEAERRLDEMEGGQVTELPDKEELRRVRTAIS